MRKLYLFFAVLLCAIFGTQSASAANFEAGETYYLKVSDDAKKDGARFAAYFFGNGETWYNMEYVYGESHILKVTPTKSFSSVIFCRMNGSATENNWNNKWNQTADITSRSGNMCITTGQMVYSSWSTYCYYLVGDFNSWTQNSASKLTDSGKGVFSSEEISFSADTSGELKVVSSEGTWYGLNATFTFSETAGASTGLSANIYAGQNNIKYNLSNAYSVNFTLGSSNHNLKFTKTSAAVTETKRELTKIALLQGSTEVASDTESPYEFSNVSVTNGSNYQIAATYTVTYSDNTTKTETKKYDTASGPTLGTAATLVEGTGTFTFAATGVVNATVTVSNNVPTSVTFTDAAAEEKTITDVYLYKSGGEVEEFALSNGKYLLDDVTISTSENYYITVKYSDGNTLKYMLDASNNIAVVSGTTYNIKERGESEYFNFSSIGSTKIDAELTVADNAPATVKFTAVPTDDPIETAYADVWLVDMNGNKLAHFTQNSTYPYIWTLDAYKINTASNDNDKSGHYRFRIYTSETDATQYSEFSTGDNYGYLGNYDQTEKYGLRDVTGNNTASFGLPANTYNFAVTTYGGDLFDAKISTSTIDLSKLPDPTPEVEEDVTSELLNMPLKKRDFDGGKVHYFVVGTRMSEWRLQPEWELLDEDGDGTYTLANRLLYNGKMGIAKVESYEDYIHQRYTFYSVNQTISGDKTLTLTTKTNPNADQLVVTCAESDNKFTAINYGKDYTKNQFTSSNTIIWGGLGEDPIRTCSPTYVGEISVTDNGASGLTMTLSGSTKDASTVAQYRTFSLVGSELVYAGAEWEGATPLRNDGSGPKDWQESWIQYDSYGKPYYDAYGNTLYQTVFQREWLENHPTIFKAEDGFEYNSRNIVFNYDAKDSHDATIPASDEEQAWTTKNSSVSSPNKNYSSTVKAEEGWQCFVVENMWLGGQFKVWTGWGGADKTQDGSGTGAGDARWYYENGGHHQGADWTISADKAVYYATERDVNNADFDLGNRIFARYVKVWWDAEEGFHNSFIQLITEVGGPEISCKRNPADSHSLQYTWTVPNPETIYNYDVKNIKIIRYRLDSKKKETKLEISSTSYAEGELNGADVNTVSVTDKVDPNYAEGGYYWYEIIIDYYGNDSAEEKEDFYRDAQSNRVYIYYDNIPNGATVTQLAYTEPEAKNRVVNALAVADGDTEGETDGGEIDSNASEDAYWSFDLAVNAHAPEDLQDRTFENDNGDVLPVLSLVKYYVVGVPKNTNYEVYTKARVGSETGTEIEALTDTELAEISESVTALNFDTDEYTYFGLKPDAANYYVMPELILHNVVPDRYLNSEGKNFTIDMVSSNGDYGRWHNANVSTARPEVVMAVPDAYFSASEFEITPVEKTSSAIDNAHMPMGIRENQPMKYSKANKVSTNDGKFTALMVTNNVLTDWAIDYTVKLTDPSNSDNSYTYTLADINGKALNAAGGVDAQFDYLPIPYEEESVGFETGNDIIDAVKTRRVSDGDFAAITSVAYKRAVSGYETGAVATTQEYLTESQIIPSQFAALVAYDAQGAFSHQIEESYDWVNDKTDSYSNAFASLTWTPNEDLHNAAGYYAASTFDKGSLTGYTVIENGGYATKAFPAEGGEVTYGTGYSEQYQLAGYEPGNEAKNFAEAAAKVGKLPIKVWHVGEGAGKPESTLYVVLTADYPVLVNPTLTAKLTDAATVSTMSLANGVFEAKGVTEKMITLSYPEILEQDLNGTTTEVINIVADGASDFRIYPNPVVDVVNVAASTELGRIEIYSVDGRLVKVVEVDDTRAAVEVGDLVKGSYIIRAAGATQRMIKK